MVSTNMVDRKFNPLRCKSGAVETNITGVADQAPEVERVIVTVKKGLRTIKRYFP